LSFKPWHLPDEARYQQQKSALSEGVHASERSVNEAVVSATRRVFVLDILIAINTTDDRLFQKPLPNSNPSRQKRRDRDGEH
jgi:hypothetical protein